MFRRGKMSAAFELAAFNLDVYELSKTVASSSGVHLSQDRLYLGRITGAAGDASKIRRVKGQVAVGWSTEPAFIGSFRLVPRHQ